MLMRWFVPRSLPHFKSWVYLMAIVSGYSIGGFYLSACQPGILGWLLTGLLFLYLSTTGQDGVVLSSAFLSLVLTVFTLVRPWPDVHILFTSLNAAQVWALALLFFWTLGIFLILLLAFAVEFSKQRGWRRWQHSLTFSLLSGFAISLGHLTFTHFSF